MTISHNPSISRAPSLSHPVFRPAHMMAGRPIHLQQSAGLPALSRTEPRPMAPSRQGTSTEDWHGAWQPCCSSYDSPDILAGEEVATPETVLPTSFHRHKLDFVQQRDIAARSAAASCIVLSASVLRCLAQFKDWEDQSDHVTAVVCDDAASQSSKSAIQLSACAAPSPRAFAQGRQSAQPIVPFPGAGSAQLPVA